MDKVISIVIPTYNMENYLHQCLDSLIINDSALFEKTEVLIINDGSKDKSLEIAHEYSTKYPKVFRVIDKPNGNYGSCVNRGVQEATGEYIKVLDADDAFYNDAYKEYVSLLLTAKVDMILTDYNRVNPNYKVIRSTHFNLPHHHLLSINDLDSDKPFEMHAITYRTKLLKVNGYSQSEGISYTDAEWSTIPLMFIKSIHYYPICLYRYLIGREGQTINPAVRVKSLWMMRKVFERLVTVFYNDSEKLGNARNLIHTRILLMARYIYRTALYSKNTETIAFLVDYDNYIKANFPQFYEELSEIKLSRLLPVRFIADWRSAPSKVCGYWKLYSLFQRIKHG